MHWRQIGPTRAGRARALAGVPSQPNVFYIGFDNGGVWRSTDYGSNWVPLFDDQPTGSIGAIAVAPSDPNIIYVGTGAGIIRPDLATGDGVYKSTDAGQDVDAPRPARQPDDRDDRRRSRAIPTGSSSPRSAIPYGPNAERGIFRSTDGGTTFEKVLYKDEYTSGNDVRIDPSNPNIVYAALWQQQQSFIEGRASAAPATASSSPPTAARRGSSSTDGLPAIIQANIAIAPSNPNVLYATVAGRAAATARPDVGFYKSTDGGEHWFQAIRGPARPAGLAQDMRPLARIGGGDLPTVTVDPKNENVVYSASTVIWRTRTAA